MVIKMDQQRHTDEDDDATATDGLPDRPGSTPADAADSEKDQRLVFIRNSKEFRMEKNKKHLRIIGNGNRVFITANLGHLEVIGNGTSIWITRNAGTIHFTGNNGRIYLGDQSDVRVADYIGTDGRVTVLEESAIIKRASKKKSRSRDSSPKQERSKCDECRKERRHQQRSNDCDKHPSKSDDEEGKAWEKKEQKEKSPPREFVYRKAFSIPIDGSLLKGYNGLLCGLHVSSEIKIFTGENGDISISNQVVL